MAKRELSTTLKNLKFMQRAREKDEIMKKEEEEERNNKIISPASGNKKCVVIMEGDPKPEAVSGRMSFQNFNPSIDKLNEHKETHKHRLFAVSRADGNEVNISRENEASEYGNDELNKDQENDVPEDLKRKKQRVDEDARGSYSSPRDSTQHDETIIMTLFGSWFERWSFKTI
ncbi:hypothetical protein SUGI_0995360 [Cryptomeria japonica]|nr:hypothetical protein SUGI_0995360 [Cryptomeria japonica]